MFKTCNRRHYWGSKEIGSCQSVELSSLSFFPGLKIGSLERVVSECFFVVRTVLGYQNVELLHAAAAAAAAAAGEMLPRKLSNIRKKTLREACKADTQVLTTNPMCLFCFFLFALFFVVPFFVFHICARVDVCLRRRRIKQICSGRDLASEANVHEALTGKHLAWISA